MGAAYEGPEGKEVGHFLGNQGKHAAEPERKEETGWREGQGKGQSED